ncbi:MAG: hypothetical protein U5L46_01765 [Agrobacterium sp.]|nr:hypothetical protein [Agrobacterium sp.]
MADLIGDLDPIKAANLKLSFADENVIHYGIDSQKQPFYFCDQRITCLQARLQVALFNILQEGDVQIRGFNLRYSARPSNLCLRLIRQDYTNRGSIVTPLKDKWLPNINALSKINENFSTKDNTKRSGAFK